MSTFYRLPATGEPIRLHTHLVVREDAHVLFGFLTLAERSLFRSLIKVSGVGGRLALAILSGMSVDEFVQCVQVADTAALSRLPGIGKRTAERLVVEMRDRLVDRAAAEAALPGNAAALPAGADAIGDAVHALVALGYKPQEAARLVRAVETRDRPTEAIIRDALRATVK